MDMLKKTMLAVVEVRARVALGELATELVRSPPAEKEAILAGIEFERWLAAGCRECRKAA